MPLSRSLTQPSGTIEYTISASDTLNSVAAKFGTTPTELGKINRMTGRIVFPGQILFVPKRHQSGSASSDGVSGACPTDDDDVPPNTPNTANSGSESSLLLSNADNPVPGNAMRINSNDTSSQAPIGSAVNTSPAANCASQKSNFTSGVSVTEHPLFQQHHHSNVYQTASLPFCSLITDDSSSNQQQQQHPPQQTDISLDQTTPSISTSDRDPTDQSDAGAVVIDPADRECLERFLKINVRYITDGQGVVPGVLLITPNALMFDPYVSDPLVIERGREFYGVTVPIELVLKTAMYSDIAHMRVKHAPEAVPSVPKPAVYFAEPDKSPSGGIVDDNVLKTAVSSGQHFDTITINEQLVKDDDDDDNDQPFVTVIDSVSTDSPLTSTTTSSSNPATQHASSSSSSAAAAADPGKPCLPEVVCPSLPQIFETPVPGFGSTTSDDKEQSKCNQDICDSVTVVVVDDEMPADDSLSNNRDPDQIGNSGSTADAAVAAAAAQVNTNQTSGQNINIAQKKPEVSTESVEKAHEAIDDENVKTEIVKPEEEYDETEALLRKTGQHIEEICAESLASAAESGQHQISIDLSETTTTSGLTGNDSPVMNLSTDDETKLSTSGSRFSSYFQTKLALSERHSAPLSQQAKMANPPLVTAISADADEQLSGNGSNCSKRRSAAGESRREQMLKRLSNPVDKIGIITKSGFNSSINATKSGINATKTGITSGIMATKSGLTTGLSVTKTGFNKVLSTPKNLMDFSSGLLRDSRGALATGSKSENDLTEHSLQVKDDSSTKRSESSLGYTNMVDCKVNAFENFDKLIPKQSSKHNKDPPLYLCIRMGKFSKKVKKHRFVPAFSFGKKKYEREYWFSVPKDKAKNLYYFFVKWAPEVYGDVDDLKGCDQRELEPINTDDELELEQDDDSDQSDLEILNIDSSIKNDSTADGEKKPKFWRRRGPMSFLKLVEDHFSTEGTSAEWNISNSSEDHSFMERFGAEPSEPILPDILGQTELLTTDIVKNLSKHLPARAEGYAWSLIYSTSLHGFSLNSLYREMKPIDTPVLLIIEDINGARFGALLSNTIRLSDHFYGTGETFVYTFYPEFALYPWTGENLFFIKGNTDSISIGAGEGNFGLWLDGDLYHGSSHPCKTFGNVTLSSEVDFVVKSIECWAFTS